MSEQTAPPADPFASDAAADPFATTAPVEGDPAANAETPVAPEEGGEIPTVDKEGQPVQAAPEAPAAEPQPAEAGDGQPPQEPPAAPAEAPEPPEAATEPQEAPEPPQEPQAQPATPAQAAAQPEAAQQAGDSTPTPAADGGKSPLRHYKLLYQTGDKQWGEYDLTKVADNMKAHTEVVEGEVMLRARNADHARRIAWVIFDRLANGVTVNPVAKSSWNPKRLAPAPPKPERERLSIS